MPPRTDQSVESRTLAVLVENEPGVLARVVGLFSARGYNIESLTVAETDKTAHTSRITIVTSGQPIIIDQIKAQLERIVSVRQVIDVTLDPAGVQRELVLVKVKATADHRAEALQLGEIFRAKVIDITFQSVIFELTGNKVKVEAFVELMGPLGLVEVSRTGVLSIEHGVEGE
ncbi:MAG: acetolactate synthase small subunit [Alphaproteobacteria bacterium]